MKLRPTRWRIGIASLSFGVIITLAGVQYQLVSVMLIGTVVSGLSFGSVFSGTLRTVMPLARPDERASLLSAYFVEGYLAFSLPAVLAGFLAPMVGLTTAADFYGIGVIVLAVGSLAATMRRR
jgi:MFS family permease